jgi:hypothetical protein
MSIPDIANHFCSVSVGAAAARSCLGLGKTSPFGPALPCEIVILSAWPVPDNMAGKWTMAQVKVHERLFRGRARAGPHPGVRYEAACTGRIGFVP